MKKFRLLVIALLLGTSMIYADVAYELDDFTSNTSVGASIVNVSGKSYLDASLSPEFTFAGLGLGLDFNLFLPLDGGSVPSDLNAVVVRKVSYDYKKEGKNLWGFQWGFIDNLTMGYGLLMDNYASSFGPNYDNSSAGLTGYVNFDSVRLRYLTTASKITAGRVQYKLPGLDMGKGIWAGVTYVQDADGVDFEPKDGPTQTRPETLGVAVDLSLPILENDKLTLFAEHARLASGNVELSDATDSNAANATAFGVAGRASKVWDYRAEYRMLKNGFIPGYYNRTYEITSTPTTSTDDINGFYVESRFDFGLAKAGFVYESYEDVDPLMTAALGFKEINGIAGVVNYRMPFGSGDNPIINAQVFYKTGKMFDYVIDWNRVYYSSDVYDDTYSVALKMNLKKGFRGLF